jgi:hypothetical protein
MRFWTTCHEMGHAFNLAHSWQKALGTPWIPLVNEPEDRSFMNYPYRVNGGQTAFFNDFDFRFSDGELLFMRHAPHRYVQMGNADWFDHHGFEEAAVSEEPSFNLELRVNREKTIFEFMEPVKLELKLTNVSWQPQIVDESILSTPDDMTLIIKKDGKTARQFVPFAQYCTLPSRRTMMPWESMYNSLCVSTGRNGWDLSEPGNYTLQVSLQVGDEDIVSNPLRLRVAPPHSYDEEYLAQDFFSEGVGRVMTFNGSHYLDSANKILEDVTEKLSDRRVALHASLVLGNEVANNYKELLEAPKEAENPFSFETKDARIEDARKRIGTALTSHMGDAIESLGHIDFKRSMDLYSDWLNQNGDTSAAASTQEELYTTMAHREVNGHKILDSVLQEVKKKSESYKVKAKK